MAEFFNRCFVCEIEIDPENTKRNRQFNLPVCDGCCGTDREMNAFDELPEGMAEGFVCGCI